MTHDCQNAQHYGSFVVGTPGEEINVIYDTCSSNLWVHNSDFCGWFSSHHFYHECKSSTYVAKGNIFKIEYSSDTVSVFYSKDTMNIGGVSIAGYIFAEVTGRAWTAQHQCMNFASSVDDHSVSIELNASDARSKTTIEGMSSISFGQSHAEEARRP